MSSEVLYFESCEGGRYRSKFTGSFSEEWSSSFSSCKCGFWCGGIFRPLCCCPLWSCCSVVPPRDFSISFWIIESSCWRKFMGLVRFAHIVEFPSLFCSWSVLKESLAGVWLVLLAPPRFRFRVCLCRCSSLYNDLWMTFRNCCKSSCVLESFCFRLLILSFIATTAISFSARRRSWSSRLNDRSSWFRGNGRSMREDSSSSNDTVFRGTCGASWLGDLCVLGSEWPRFLTRSAPGVGDTVLKLIPFDLTEEERVTLRWVISNGLEGGVFHLTSWFMVELQSIAKE